jgi:hypothetical protein
MEEVLSFGRFRRFARLTGLLALVLGFAMVVSAQPCPDDFLVAMGQAPDAFVAAATTHGAALDPGPSVCPCSCHMGVVILAAPSSHPGLRELELPTSIFRSPLDLSSPPNTPPPRS